jgi:hypothetical protein
MGILGLTHDERGTSLQRLPVTIKVSIGRGPDPAKGRKYPEPLDHFEFLEKNTRGADVVWEADPDVTKVMEETYGKNPREIGIIILDDEPENVFRTSYAWWTNTECRCRGELVEIQTNGSAQFAMQAVRRTKDHPEGEEWPPRGTKIPGCGDGCPDLERGDCKPSGDLYFILDKFPMLGAVCRLHTTSYRSIRNVSNGIMQIRTITGGRLAGIRAMLKVDPEKISYEDDKGAKHSSTAHILSLRIDAPSMQKLIENMTETAKLFQDTRKLLGGRRIEIVEDDEERASEIAGEFHPPIAGQPALPPKAEIPTGEEIAQRSKIHRMCSTLGFNQARENMMLGQYQGRLGELETHLSGLCGDEQSAEPSAPTKEPEKPADAVRTGKPAAAGKTKGFDF